MGRRARQGGPTSPRRAFRGTGKRPCPGSEPEPRRSNPRAPNAVLRSLFPRSRSRKATSTRNFPSGKPVSPGAQPQCPPRAVRSLRPRLRGGRVGRTLEANPAAPGPGGRAPAPGSPPGGWPSVTSPFSLRHSRARGHPESCRLGWTVSWLSRAGQPPRRRPCPSTNLDKFSGSRAGGAGR